MKKTMMIIALFVVLMISMASRSDRDYQAAKGFSAPELELVGGSDSSKVELSDLKGRYVLINFWAASDAESRIAAHGFDRMMEKADKERLCLLQVNMDRSMRLFREIVRRDRLNEAQQFSVTAEDASAVKNAFHLNEGLQSYLIDPDGEIIAVNPSIETVARAIAS